jgi:hypothetical protein
MIDPSGLQAGFELFAAPMPKCSSDWHVEKLNVVHDVKELTIQMP